MLNLQFLEQKMTAKGLSYRRISNLMGFTGSGTIWKWFHGTNQMRVQYLERLAQILEVSISDFFLQNNRPQPTCKGGDCE